MLFLTLHFTQSGLIIKWSLSLTCATYEVKYVVDTSPSVTSVSVFLYLQYPSLATEQILLCKAAVRILDTFNPIQTFRGRFVNNIYDEVYNSLRCIYWSTPLALSQSYLSGSISYLHFKSHQSWTKRKKQGDYQMDKLVTRILPLWQEEGRERSLNYPEDVERETCTHATLQTMFIQKIFFWA